MCLCVWLPMVCVGLAHGLSHPWGPLGRPCLVFPCLGWSLRFWGDGRGSSSMAFCLGACVQLWLVILDIFLVFIVCDGILDRALVFVIPFHVPPQWLGVLCSGHTSFRSCFGTVPFRGCFPHWLLPSAVFHSLGNLASFRPSSVGVVSSVGLGRGTCIGEVTAICVAWFHVLPLPCLGHCSSAC